MKISLEKAQAEWQEDNVILIDVRSKEDFLTGHLPGAVSIYFLDLEKHLEELRAYRKVFVYCNTGRKTDYAEKYLEMYGIPVYNIGGLYPKK